MTPVAIVAHPKRARMATQLAAQVGPDVALCWDTYSEGAEANHLRAWRWLAESGAPWGVVLEDDVVLCRGFMTQLQLCFAHSPADIVALYLGRGRPPHRQTDISRALGSMDPFSFLVSNEMLSCQGYAMRTELFAHARSVAHFTNPKLHYPPLPIDEAMTAWVRQRRHRYDVAYPVPSLVDHRPGPSLVTHWDEATRDGKTALVDDASDPSGADLPEIRRAWLFGRHDQWSSTSIRLGTTFTPRRGKQMSY